MRPIMGPSVQKLKYYSAPGYIEVYACKDPNRPGGIRLVETEDAISMKIWNNTSFLSRVEVADLIRALDKAASKQWPGWSGRAALEVQDE